MSDPILLEQQCEWKSADFSDEALWTEYFSEAECKELDTALRTAVSKSEDVLDIERGDFPLPTLAPRLATIEDGLINGRGFVRLRGLDRSRRTRPTSSRMSSWDRKV